jgi:hypothetical protein
MNLTRAATTRMKLVHFIFNSFHRTRHKLYSPISHINAMNKADLRFHTLQDFAAQFFATNRLTLLQPVCNTA